MEGKKYALKSQGTGQGIHMRDPFQEFDFAIFRGSFEDFADAELQEIRDNPIMVIKDVLRTEGYIRVICNDKRAFAKDYIYTAKEVTKEDLARLMK
ncbi:hypothetical protein [Bacillus sp. NEAU-Y102]